MSRTCIIFYIILTHESASSFFKDVEADFRFFHFVTEEVNSTSLLSGNIIKGYIVIMTRTSKKGMIAVLRFYSYSQCFFPNSCISGSRSIRKGKFHFP